MERVDAPRWPEEARQAEIARRRLPEEDCSAEAWDQNAIIARPAKAAIGCGSYPVLQHNGNLLGFVVDDDASDRMTMPQIG